MKRLVSTLLIISTSLVFMTGCGSSCEHEYLADVHAATHLEEGYCRYVCVFCGDTYFETIPKTGHEWKYTWNKTDLSHHVKSCICGETYTEEHNGVVTDHKIGVHVSGEYDVYSCVCGYTWNEGFIDDDHKLIYTSIDEETHKGTCACGHEIIEEHMFNLIEVVKEATTTEEGLKILTCSTCNFSKEVVIEKLKAEPIVLP